MKSLFTAALFSLLSLSFSIPSLAQQKSREELLNEIADKRAELVRVEKEFLSPSEADRAAHVELLSQPNTGLIRLLPRELFDSDTYRKNKKTISLRGGGAYYSFTRLTHEYGWGSDISLDSNYLSVGFAGFDYGMLLKLGDVPLENVTLESATVHTLANYSPPLMESDVRLEQGRFSAGTKIDDAVYKSRVPLEIGATLLLRAISHERSDVLVALRTVRKDTDGSVIIAWKLLKKFSKPALARNN